MLIDCTCGATNRLPGATTKRHQCGKCRHVFTPQELVKARPEPAPPRSALDDGTLFGDEPTHACKDEDDCAWEGTAEEMAEGRRCPDCNKKCRKLDD